MERFRSLGGETFDGTELVNDDYIELNAVYRRTDKDGNPDREGKHMLFGSYPQSRVTDAALNELLNELAGELPTSDEPHHWISYKYYIENKNDTDYMWYRDIEHEGERYRGVYFSSYRPYWTGNLGSADNSYQSANGYYNDTVYWFKYELLRWEILAERDGKAWLASDMCIDSQAYRNVDFDNNYAKSSIREWLNGELFNVAFSELERAQISLENVDNSIASTGVSDNRYACADTIDYIHLLSVKEAEGIDTAARKKVATDYARCQGIYVDSDNDNSCWWHRSPKNNINNLARYINSNGDFDYGNIDDTTGGVRPALWINL